jgi:hypothetical protein
MPRCATWTTKLAALLDHKERNGDVLVPKRYVDESSGIKLGYWVDHLRSGHMNLSDSQRNDLDRMGFVWNASKTQSPSCLNHCADGSMLELESTSEL